MIRVIIFLSDCYNTDRKPGWISYYFHRKLVSILIWLKAHSAVPYRAVSMSSWVTICSISNSSVTFFQCHIEAVLVSHATCRHSPLVPLIVSCSTEFFPANTNRPCSVINWWPPLCLNATACFQLLISSTFYCLVATRLRFIPSDYTKLFSPFRPTKAFGSPSLRFAPFSLASTPTQNTHNSHQGRWPGKSLSGPGAQTCATLMKWEMTAALCGAVGLLSTMSWIHWETLLKRVMKRSKMGLSTVQPCITKLW